MPETAGLARTADSAKLRPHHVRTIALAGAVVGVVVLPIAAAQATPPQNHETKGASSASVPGTYQVSGAPSASPGAGVQALTPEFCGAVRTATTAAGAVRVQACVDQADGSATGRVYVTNGTSKDQLVALNLTRADGSVVQVQCTIIAGDAAGLCETGPTAISSGKGAFDAIAELATQGAPLSAGVVHVESGLIAPTAK